MWGVFVFVVRGKIVSTVRRISLEGSYGTLRARPRRSPPQRDAHHGVQPNRSRADQTQGDAFVRLRGIRGGRRLGGGARGVEAGARESRVSLRAASLRRGENVCFRV